MGGGHLLAETAPQDVLKVLVPFLGKIADAG
jgi:hypothetical protein